MMRSRSSRLFIVLIHLVGVSTNLPSSAFSNAPFWQGIRGVQPMAIFLESLQLPPGEDGDGGGLDGLLRRLRAAGYEVPEEDVLGEPFWLQDDNDGMCLGPGGTFGQCGDASLWLVRKRRRRRRRGRQSVLSRLILRKDSDDGADAPSVWGYALELVDVSAGRRRPRDDGSSSDAVADRGSNYSDNEGECLVSWPASDEDEGSSLLRIGSCASNGAWVWRIGGDGVLSQDTRAIRLSLTRRQRQQQISQRRRQRQSLPADNADDDRRQQTIIRRPAVDPLRRLLLDSAPQIVPSGIDADIGLLWDEGTRANCIWRADASTAVATQCARDSSEASAPAQSDNRRLVNFSLIRYQTSTDGARLPRLPPEEPSATEASSSNDDAATSTDGCLPSDDDNSSPQACQSQQPASENTIPVEEDMVVPAMFPELKPASQLLFGTPSPSAIKTKRPRRSRPAKAASASFSSHMVGASPLTLGAVAYPRSAKLGAGLPGRAAASSLVGPDAANRNILHYPPSQSSVQSPIPHGDAPHKVRKIPKHPYIEASTDGVWVDGETGLEYPTDLSEYLGQDRKETGRHTLMGVGQYTRTVFKIKVR